MKNVKFENCIVLKVQMEIGLFLCKFQTPSLFYRKLFKSNASIGGRSNRDFFKKYFCGGYYTFLRDSTQIEVIFILRPKSQITNSIISSINARLLKLNPKMEISMINGNFRDDLCELLDKEEVKYMLQPIGDDYFK
jgi:hypothetical protein